MRHAARIVMMSSPNSRGQRALGSLGADSADSTEGNGNQASTWFAPCFQHFEKCKHLVLSPISITRRASMRPPAIPRLIHQTENARWARTAVDTDRNGNKKIAREYSPASFNKKRP